MKFCFLLIITNLCLCKSGWFGKKKTTKSPAGSVVTPKPTMDEAGAVNTLAREILNAFKVKGEECGKVAQGSTSQPDITETVTEGGAGG